MQNSNTFKRIRIAKENPLAGASGSVPTAARHRSELAMDAVQFSAGNLDHWICRT